MKHVPRRRQLAAEFCQQRVWGTLLPRGLTECSDLPPALGDMVRVTCRIEISQNTITQAYSLIVSQRVQICVAFV